jgi:RHS repeat-associated protein
LSSKGAGKPVNYLIEMVVPSPRTLIGHDPVAEAAAWRNERSREDDPPSGDLPQTQPQRPTGDGPKSANSASATFNSRPDPREIKDLGMCVTDYGYRYYHPELGRWLSRDPIGERGGFNLYSFINNTPTNKIDTLGLEEAEGWTNVGMIGEDEVFRNNKTKRLFVVKYEKRYGDCGYYTIERNIRELTKDEYEKYSEKEQHYGRNIYNDPPVDEKSAINKKWTLLSDAQSVYHKNHSKDNKKYVSPDGKQEAVYDKDGKLVVDDEDQGTYNNSPPDDWLGHLSKDMIPYIKYGNTPSDKTPFLDRVHPYAKFFILPKNPNYPEPFYGHAGGARP